MPRARVAVLIPLLVAGCAGSQTTQAESAGGTADTLVKTCAAGRAHASLEVLTPAARNAFARAPSALQGCLELLGLSFPGVSPTEVPGQLSQTRVVSVRANDLTATAELRAPDGEGSRVQLEKSRGAWAVTYRADGVRR
jgi:hypothetical protein